MSSSAFLYRCGCSVGYMNMKLSSVTVCPAHQPEAQEGLHAIAKTLRGVVTGSPTSLDTDAMATALEKIIDAGVVAMDETDGSA